MDMMARFRRDGFLTFETGLSPQEIALLRASLSRLHEEKRGFKEGLSFDAMGIDDGVANARFPQILHPRAFAPELMNTGFFQMAQAIAIQLLGPNARFKADISLMKPARIGEVTPWHQDEAFADPAFEYSEVSFWLALQPVDESNSCMCYAPGTHRGPVLPHGFPNGDVRIHALQYDGDIDGIPTVSCPLPAGGCVIHTGRTLHGAGPNPSGADRHAYALIFDLVPVPAREHRVFSWRQQQKTARAQRELIWRRKGGLLVHLWNQRRRIRLASPRTMLWDLRKASRAIWLVLSRRSRSPQ